MCFVYVDRPLTLPLPLVDKHGHFDNPLPLLCLRGLYTVPNQLTLLSKIQYGKCVVEILLALNKIVSFSAPNIMASSNKIDSG